MQLHPNEYLVSRRSHDCPANRKLRPLPWSGNCLITNWHCSRRIGCLMVSSTLVSGRRRSPCRRLCGRCTRQLTYSHREGNLTILLRSCQHSMLPFVVLLPLSLSLLLPPIYFLEWLMDSCSGPSRKGRNSLKAPCSVWRIILFSQVQLRSRVYTTLSLKNLTVDPARLHEGDFARLDRLPCSSCSPRCWYASDGLGGCGEDLKGCGLFSIAEYHCTYCESESNITSLIQ